MSGTGWGGAPWGGSGWGGAPVTPLQLVSAAAVSENAIQLQFTRAVYFSGLLDAPDASSRKRFTVTPDAATKGRNGQPARPVLVTTVQVVDAPNLVEGQALLITLDRPMTPYPASYSVSCTGLWASDLSVAIDTTAAAQSLLATYRPLVTPSLDAATSSVRGDFANPQVESAAKIAGIPASLGTFGVDDSGDYAADKGVPSYKKRIVRRLISRKNSFAHLAGRNFGADVPSYGKQLSTAQRRAQLVADVEAQVAADPETKSVTCSVVASSSPYLFRVQVIAVTTAGQTVRFGMPIAA